MVSELLTEHIEVRAIGDVFSKRLVPKSLCPPVLVELRPVLRWAILIPRGSGIRESVVEVHILEQVTFGEVQGSPHGLQCLPRQAEHEVRYDVDTCVPGHINGPLYIGLLVSPVPFLRVRTLEPVSQPVDTSLLHG